MAPFIGIVIYLEDSTCHRRVKRIVGSPLGKKDVNISTRSRLTSTYHRVCTSEQFAAKRDKHVRTRRDITRRMFASLCTFVCRLNRLLMCYFLRAMACPFLSSATLLKVGRLTCSSPLRFDCLPLPGRSPAWLLLRAQARIWSLSATLLLRKSQNLLTPKFN